MHLLGGLQKNLRLQIAIPTVCSLDFSYILTCKSVKLRKVVFFELNTNKFLHVWSSFFEKYDHFPFEICVMKPGIDFPCVHLAGWNMVFLHRNSELSGYREFDTLRK